MGKKSKSKPTKNPAISLPEVTDQDYTRAHEILSKQYNEVFNCNISNTGTETKSESESESGTESQQSNTKEYKRRELYNKFTKIIQVYQKNSINKDNISKIYNLSGVDFALSNLCEEGIKNTLKQAALIGFSEKEVTQLTLQAYSLDITTDMLDKIKHGIKQSQQLSQANHNPDTQDSIPETDKVEPSPTQPSQDKSTEATTHPDSQVSTQNASTDNPPDEDTNTDKAASVSEEPEKKPKFRATEFYHNLLNNKVETETFDDETKGILKGALERLISTRVTEAGDTPTAMDSVRQLTNLARTLERITGNMEQATLTKSLTTPTTSESDTKPNTDTDTDTPSQSISSS